MCTALWSPPRRVAGGRGQGPANLTDVITAKQPRPGQPGCLKRPRRGIVSFSRAAGRSGARRAETRPDRQALPAGITAQARGTGAIPAGHVLLTVVPDGIEGASPIAVVTACPADIRIVRSPLWRPRGEENSLETGPGRRSVTWGEHRLPVAWHERPMLPCALPLFPFVEKMEPESVQGPGRERILT